MKNIRITRLVMVVIICLSSIVHHASALQDYNTAGYVDDLSSLPGLEIYQHKPSQHSMSQVIKWIHSNQMVCTVGLTVVGAVLMYVIHAELRHKINEWLGLQVEQSDDVR